MEIIGQDQITRLFYVNSCPFLIIVNTSFIAEGNF